MPAHLIAEEGPARGLVLNFEEGEEWIIGRDSDECDFLIEDHTVSRKHARIYKTPDGIYLKNLSKVNPTLVNDEEHKEAVLLKEKDRVQIGHTLFSFSEAAPKKAQDSYDDIFQELEPEERPFLEQEEPKIPPAPPKPEMTAYDTIFEDTDMEEELPFSLISESPLLLKVIAGPNAGAEIGIEKGRVYTIGKDPNACDIVFQDLSVSRMHSRLTVGSEGEIEIEDLASKNGTSVNNQLIQEKRVVTPQDLIALGTTVFMIIDRQAPQETIYSPILPSYEAPKEESGILKKEEEKRDWKKEPIPMKTLVLTGSFAAVFLIVFLSFFSLFKSNTIEIVRKEPISEIKEALEKFPEVQFSFNPSSGKLFLVGHVLTPVEFQEMKFRLGKIPFITSVEENVVIDEGVWRMMNEIIADNPNWRGISIHSPKAGRFVVNGYIATTDEAVKLYEYLTVNFPYLDRLENQMVIEQDLNTQLQSLIASENLGGVTFTLANGSVVLSGQYSENMQKEFNDFLKKINRVKGITSVQSYATAMHPNLAGIDISGDYQVTGTSTYDGRGFGVVMNGKIYTLGDRVNGMTITSIEPNTILLEKDGLRYKIDYTL